MKIKSSLKSAKTRDKNNQLVRRKVDCTLLTKLTQDEGLVRANFS